MKPVPSRSMVDGSGHTLVATAVTWLEQRCQEPNTPFLWKRFLTPLVLRKSFFESAIDVIEDRR